jgi:hypothetical protein
MKKHYFVFVLAFVFSMIFTTAAFGQDEPETLVVTSVNTRGWSSVAPLADTRPGGSFALIQDSTAPLGTGAASLITDNTTTAKVQYMHAAATALSAVTTLGYSSKTNSASFINGAPSYQLALCLGGLIGTTCNGFTTMVYEPYNNGYSITMGQWAGWDVAAGLMWSSRTVNDGSCQVAAGGGGAPFYTLSMLQTACPNAQVVAYGVNVGSNNPSWNTEVDKFIFQNTTYDFEVYSTPATQEDCKKGGWSTFNPPTGPYKNQGQCVAASVPN